MTSAQPRPLEVGNQVTWTGSLKPIMGTRTGMILEVLDNPTIASHFDAYLVRRDDGEEGVYYRSPLQVVSSDLLNTFLARARSIACSQTSNAAPKPIEPGRRHVKNQ